MGGKPSKGTSADGRLKDNQPPPKQGAKTAATPKATPPKGKTSK